MRARAEDELLLKLTQLVGDFEADWDETLSKIEIVMHWEWEVPKIREYRIHSYNESGHSMFSSTRPVGDSELGESPGLNGEISIYS
jgi:hypothetical protein